MLDHAEFASSARIASVSITDTLSHADLLGPWFSGQSWATWRAILRTAFGLSLDDAERALFHAVAERDPPITPCREFWAFVGRRGGEAPSRNPKKAGKSRRPYPPLKPAAFAEQKGRDRIKRVMALLEPAAILVIGVVIGAIVISLFTAIASINNVRL